MLTKTTDHPSIPVPRDLTKSGMGDFEQKLNELLKEGPAIVAVDCGDLRQVTSTHIQCLWVAYQICEETSIPFYLKSPSRTLLRVLNILDIADFFRSEETCLGKFYTDEFVPQADAIELASEKFCRFLISVPVDEIAVFELRTIFYEVATNIRLHSEMNSSEKIVFSAITDSTALRLTFTDSGKAFNPLEHDSPNDLRDMAKLGRRRGLGITMIKKIADKVSYVRHNNAHNVLIVDRQLGGNR